MIPVGTTTPDAQGPPAGLAEALSRRPGERWGRFAGRISNAFGLLLLLVLATYVLSSLTPYSGWSAVAQVAIASASGCVALATAEAGPATVRRGIGLSVVALVLAVVAAIGGRRAPLGVSALIEMLLLSAAAFTVLRAVVSETEVGFRTILGAVSVFVLLALLFAFLYAGIARIQSGPFFAGDPRLGNGDYVFFSLTTLTTTGYGNLVPAAQPGKVLAGLEMLTGQLFLVTLIAGLVSLWRPGELARARRRKAGGDPS